MAPPTMAGPAGRAASRPAPTRALGDGRRRGVRRANGSRRRYAAAHQRRPVVDDPAAGLAPERRRDLSVPPAVRDVGRAPRPGRAVPPLRPDLGPRRRSPLRALCAGVAEDPRLLELMAGAPRHPATPQHPAGRRPLPPARRAPTSPLAARYPSVAEWTGRTAGAWRPRAAGKPIPTPTSPPSARASTATSWPPLIATRVTQTNEIGRCTALLPAFATVGRHWARPLALVDLGASAGLNLLFDRYAYAYSHTEGTESVTEAGDPARRCTSRPRSRSGRLPPLARPPVGLPGRPRPAPRRPRRPRPGPLAAGLPVARPPRAGSGGRPGHRPGPAAARPTSPGSSGRRRGRRPGGGGRPGPRRTPTCASSTPGWPPT